MIETSGEGGSAWLTPPLGGINLSLKERERFTGCFAVSTCIILAIYCNDRQALLGEAVHNYSHVECETLFGYIFKADYLTAREFNSTGDEFSLHGDCGSKL